MHASNNYKIPRSYIDPLPQTMVGVVVDVVVGVVVGGYGCWVVPSALVIWIGNGWFRCGVVV